MKDETVKTTQNSSNITIPSLNKSSALNAVCSFINNLAKTEISLVGGNHEYMETDVKISVQSSLKPHIMWVTLYLNTLIKKWLDRFTTVTVKAKSNYIILVCALIVFICN